MVSVKVPTTHAVSREGVNAVQALFESGGCVFQEVAQQNDIGKDAYVDIPQEGLVTGTCAALQIKSGESFRASHGDYFITVGKHSDSWRGSTVPVFGLVYDPSDRLLRWADLTGYLRAHPQQFGGSIPVPRNMILDGRSLFGEVRSAVSECAAGGRGSIALDLLSPGALQAEAVFDAWALGRHDARYLILLRRLILELLPRALRHAIAALAHAAPHPDIFWTKDNWILPEIKRQVQGHSVGHQRKSPT